MYNPQEKSPTQINNNDYLINLEHRPGSAVNPPRKSVTKNSSAGVSNGRPLSAPQNLVKKDPTSGSTPVACSKTKETGPPKIYIQSKQTIEQIYNSPYLKYQEVGAELKSGNGINSGNRNPGLNAYASTLGTEKTSRPSSAKRTRGSGEYNNGAGGNGSRPISSGSKTVNRLRNTTNPMSERNAKLAEMFDDNLLNKLDIVIGNTR